MLRAALVRSRLVALVASASLVVGVLPLATATPAQAAVPPAQPTLTSPADGDQVSANPVLAWSAVSGAVKYQVDVSSSAGFSPLSESVTTQELRYAPLTELPLGELYWRVKAIDAGGLSGEYAFGTFTKAWGTAPNVLTPADGAVLVFPTDPVLFSWDALPGATSYRLEVDDTDGFVGATGYDTKNTVFVLTDPVTVGQPFYWRVRGVSGSLTSDWSPTFTFSSTWPQKPTLVYPAAGATGVTDVYFDWDPVPGAKTYQLQVSPNRDWTNNNTVDVTVKSTRYEPPKPLNNGSYYWRVRAVDAKTNYGQWTDGQQLFERGWPDTPTLLWPQDGTSTSVANPDDPTWQNPTFSWTPAKRASWYRLRWATDADMTQNVNGCVTNRTTFSPVSAEDGVSRTIAGSCTWKFVSGTTYYWDVMAIDNPVTNAGLDIWGPPKLGDSVFGLRSQVKSFTYNPPVATDDTPRQLDVSEYLTPANCDPASCSTPERETPTFTWAAIPGADSYTITVALDANFTNIYRTYATPYNRLTPRDSWRDNQANQAYYWNVRPSDLGLDKTRYSVFQKQTAPVHLTAPAAGSAQANDFTFEWEDYLDTNQALTPAAAEAGKSYRIQVSTVSDFATTLDTQVVNTPFYTPSGRTYPEGPIYWRVQAIDGSNNDLTMSKDTEGRLTKQSPTPTLSYPANGATVGSVPYLQWDALEYAMNYDLQIDNDANFSSPLKTVTTAMTAWAYTDALAAGTYYWRVQRNDAESRDGAWSQGRSFVLAPEAPSPTVPADGASPSPQALLLQWTATRPSPKYRIELSTSPTFAGQVSGYPKDTVMSTSAPTTLLANGTYYWRVKALNASSAVVSTSATMSFTVDSTNPRVSTLSPTSNASLGTVFSLTFSEPVTGVDADSLKVTVAGSSVALPGTVTTPSSTEARFTPKDRLVPGQTYSIAVSSAVRDRGGNALLPYTANVRASTTVEENSVAICRTWGRWADASASGGSMKLAQRSGSTLTFPFTGTSVGLVGYVGTSGGYASISVDGVLRTNAASFYATAGAYQKEIWSASDLAEGDHVLKVSVNGTKPSKSAGTWAYVDGFTVGGSTVEETDGAVVDGFSRTSTSKASGSAYEATDFRTGTGRTTPTLSFTFRGTGLSWYGTKAKTFGKAVVYIDGAKKATVDLYKSSTKYKQKLWSTTSLSNTVHTAKVVVSGSKRSSAKGYAVSFDYFTIK